MSGNSTCMFLHFFSQRFFPKYPSPTSKWEKHHYRNIRKFYGWGDAQRNCVGRDSHHAWINPQFESGDESKGKKYWFQDDALPQCDEEESEGKLSVITPSAVR
jgi:hypothetical protein